MKKNTVNSNFSSIPSVIQENPYLFLILLCIIVYAQSLFFGIVDLDDNIFVLENQDVTNNIANFYLAFQRDVFLKYTGGYYRPILLITFFIDKYIGGSNPSFYHFTNIILHIVATTLLYKFLLKIKTNINLTLFFSTFFAIHPLFTQAVSWIPGRNDTLLFIFVVASFLFLIDKKIFMHLLFFALALFTKENAIVFVFLVLFYLYFVKRELNFNANKFILIIGWSVVIALWYTLREKALPGSTLETVFANSNLNNLLNNSGGILLYLGKIFFPFNLSVLPILTDSTLIFGFAFMIIMLVMYLKTKQPRNNYILFGILWFLFFMVPAILKRGDFIEHRIYVPMLGIFIVFAEFDFFKNLNFEKKWKLYFVLSVIVIFLIINVVHSRNFVNAEIFWDHAVKSSPHYALSHKNLGCELYKKGNFNDAEKEFIKSLELNPYEPMSHNNIGLIYMNKGDFVKAEKEYFEEIKINPNYDVVQYNLGVLYYLQSNILEAKKWWERSTKLNPNNIEVYVKLLDCSMKLNDEASVKKYRMELEKRGVRLVQ